ncbi:MAG: hypothetical protein DUD26_06705 [Eubacteriaceae bacterium]|uniref:Uncharacterized protein n=1 Tax=Candidatus Pseudoramibacter fermentans TaxID=2594427 RepID=A0A6L5GPQ5_9FIRM|nr:hypothetical protein [Candidatus Pseudoramibacter fermentans]RRF92455.1 MAG: hypothetical protein DUD26_06705 [Eubacteriaceae bacterium]
MIQAYYTFCHETLNIHMYTIPLIVAGALAILFGLLHWRKQKKREDEFEDKMEEKYRDADNGTAQDGAKQNSDPLFF